MKRTLLTDLALAPVAGYAGTKIMEPVSSKLYELESQADREREDAVRPGMPYAIAARKATDLLGVDLSDKNMERLSLLFHYGLAIQWAPLYALLRRRTALGPAPAGLVTGAAMSLIADELMTPALGFSAPNRAYPLSTHLRGFAAHLVFGLGVAATTGPGGGCSGDAPDPPARRIALQHAASSTSSDGLGTCPRRSSR